MTRRLVIGALMGALMVVSAGCSEEWVDQIDCNNKKGLPGEGKQWACVDNKCVRRDVTPPPAEDDDAGTQTDAGTPADAGTETDAGTQTDAGTPADAGTMTVKEGEACTSTAACMAGLYCDASGSARTCQPLHIAVTRSLSANATDAVVVRYKSPAGGTNDPVKLSESTTGQSRFPRWNKDGTAVAFVEESGNTVTLFTRSIPLTAGQKTQLTTGAPNEADTSDFRYMEWEPSSSIAWSKTTKSGSTVSSSGISVISGTGGAVQTASDTGVFPSWAANGQSFVYNSGGLGLQTRTVGGAATPVTGATQTSEQPLHNTANDVLLYLDTEGKSDTSGSFSVPLSRLFTLPTGGGTPTVIADISEQAITGGKLKSYIANHTWSPPGTHVAYVRVYYFLSEAPTGAGSGLCGNTGVLCPSGQQGNVIYVHRIGSDGKPVGSELMLASEATLPSFSPDGHFIAYVSGGKLKVQQINPEAMDEATLKVGNVIEHTWSSGTVPTSQGDDYRPRWQPRGP